MSHKYLLRKSHFKRLKELFVITIVLVNSIILPFVTINALGSLNRDGDNVIPGIDSVGYNLSDEITKQLLGDNDASPNSFPDMPHPGLSIAPNKIERALMDRMIQYGQLSEKEDPNLNKITVKIIILFSSHLTPNERISVLDKYLRGYTLNYNFKIVPAVSISVDYRNLEILLKNVDTIGEIKAVTLNHQGVISSQGLNIGQLWDSSLSNGGSYGTGENWSAPFSYDNWWIKAIGADSLNYTGKGVKVAIIDTGVSPHLDFYTYENTSLSRIIAAKNFTVENGETQNNYTVDDYGHGTHVAGIVAGNGYASDGKYRGVAPDAYIINAKASNSSGFFEEDDIIAAIQWSVDRGADIISMSLGDTWPEVWTAEAYALWNATKQGVLCVAAAGNSGPGFFTSGSPASAMATLSVGATDINNHLATFSSWGPTHMNQILPEVCAPGVNIIAPLAFGSNIYVEGTLMNETIDGSGVSDYIALSGTSMATPMVSGAAAILMEAFPEATPETIRAALIEGAKKVARPVQEGFGAGIGAGLINVSASFNYLRTLNDTWGDVNYVVKAFSDVIPYAPFDLLKFPGDEQLYNITIFSGNSTTVTLKLPSLEGVQIDSDVDLSSITFSNHGIKSVSLHFKILYNSTIGSKSGYIEIRDAATDRLLDTVLVNITVEIPKARILIDTYHSMADSYPDPLNLFNQISMYHSIFDLYAKGYLVDFYMDNWTYGYRSQYDAQILNPSLLSNYDLLILPAPIIPYSDFEIKAISDFYDNGGSVLFLETRSRNLAQNSVNLLLEQLNSSITLSDDEIFNYEDYGLFATYDPFVVENITGTHPIFDGVDKLKFGFSGVFTYGSDAGKILEYDNKTLMVEQFGDGDKGKLIAMGDYHPIMDGFYDDRNFAGNHSRFLENLIEYLVGDARNSSVPAISIRLDNRNINESTIRFSSFVFNTSTYNLITSMDDVGNGINATLILSNSTEIPLNITESPINSGIYIGSYQMNPTMCSNRSLILRINVTVNGIKSESYIRFYYFPEVIHGYNNISLLSDQIDRSPGKTYDFNVDFGNSTNDSYEIRSYFSITTNSFICYNGLQEFQKDVDFNGTNYLIELESSEIKTSGLGIIYGTVWKKLEDGLYYPDITPDRFMFGVKNYSPKIDNKTSIFGGVSLSKTQSNQSLIPILAESNQYYRILINTSETVDFEDTKDQLNVSAVLIPIYVYRGYIYPLHPTDFYKYDLVYNSSGGMHEGYIVFPDHYTFSGYTDVFNKSSRSDAQYYFSLLYIQVKDRDGGTDGFYLIVVLDYEVPRTTINIADYWPLFLLIGLIVVICIVLNRKKRKLQGTNVYTGANLPDPNFF